MAEPQPGLLPIIPNLPAQAGPSPLIPVIVLFIVGSLRWALLKMLEMWSSAFESESYYWSASLDSMQANLNFAALLIPLCLILAIKAFGIPQVNPARNAPPVSPFVKAITDNIWTSMLLLVIIMVLLLSIPIRSILLSPWQQPLGARPAYTIIPGGRQGQARSGVCQELAILKRRCENWKGTSRNTVCRELAQLQKRCERSRF